MGFQLNFLVPGIHLCVEEGMTGQVFFCDSSTALYLNMSVWVFSYCFRFMMLVSFDLFFF